MFPPVSKKTEYCPPQPVSHTELVQESSLKLVLDAAIESKDTSEVKETSIELLNKVESNMEREDCVECLNIFFIFRGEFELYQNNYTLHEDLKIFYDNNIVVSDYDIIKICCDTIKQSACPDWYAIRRPRISVSTNVHRIKSRETKSIENLLSRILNPRNVDCEASRYGLSHERQCSLTVKMKFYSIRFWQWGDWTEITLDIPSIKHANGLDSTIHYSTQIDFSNI
ncbi:hypothetical protein JTB14_001541 [Gonioctena quinquepunctata]|nr:hypothetical protein JTB14_001541 [Gonioctena quinquepunctata]